MSYTQSAPETIQACFSTIAERYDRANAVLSFGMQKMWNRALIAPFTSSTHLLDLCAGTGAIAFDYLKKNPRAEATLLDFCPEMLAVAEKRGAALQGRFSLCAGDAQNLPFEDERFDGAAIAYGIRNVAKPRLCFEEVHRVLRPGSPFAFLELTRPTSPFIRVGHALYLKTLLPLLGGWIAHNKEAYAYLSRSIEAFLSPEKLIEELQSVGFTGVTKRTFLGGVATLVTAKRC